jgi:hypothetical protein
MLNSNQRIASTAVENRISPERAILYNEDPNDPRGQSYVGSVFWRTERASTSDGESTRLSVRADVKIPDPEVALTLIVRRNTDPKLLASHTVEMVFSLPSDFAGGGIGKVPGILMKSNEQARGRPLAVLSVKVQEGRFLFGLSNVDTERVNNIWLLNNQQWFDIPIVYSNGRRAILSLAKGTTGQRAFAEALTAWNDDATRAESSSLMPPAAGNARPGEYKPNYSQKIEADNGAAYAIDLKSARRFAAGVEAGVYDQGRGGIVPMYFDCAGHMGELGGPMSYVPPRSVGARLAAVACAEADRHPER